MSVDSVIIHLEEKSPLPPLSRSPSPAMLSQPVTIEVIPAPEAISQKQKIVGPTELPLSQEERIADLLERKFAPEQTIALLEQGIALSVLKRAPPMVEEKSSAVEEKASPSVVIEIPQPPPQAVEVWSLDEETKRYTIPKRPWRISMSVCSIAFITSLLCGALLYCLLHLPTKEKLDRLAHAGALPCTLSSISHHLEKDIHDSYILYYHLHVRYTYQSHIYEGDVGEIKTRYFDHDAVGAYSYNTTADDINLQHQYSNLKLCYADPLDHTDIYLDLNNLKATVYGARYIGSMVAFSFAIFSCIHVLYLLWLLSTADLA